MPVEEFESGGGGAPSSVDTLPGVGGAPPPPPGVVPPGNPFAPPTLPPGLRGKAKWDAIQQSKPGLFSGPMAYREWLRTLPDDHSDPEYQSLLDTARKQALLDDPFSAARDSNDPNAPKLSGAIDAARAFSGKEDPNKPSAYGPMGTGPTMQSAGGPLKPPGEEAKPLTPEDEKKLIREREKLKHTASQPVFRGRDVGTDELYQPAGPQDPYLQGFLSENGIILPGNDRNKALRSGEYVYMGTESNAELGTTRDVYMYVKDAHAQAVKVDGAVISKYQTELGLEVTGKMDGYLTQQWDWAVQMAQRSAVAGDKMSVREWFDIRIQSAIAQKKAGGSGGGGGGGAQDLEEFDYYRGMMQILGDISGVEG